MITYTIEAEQDCIPVRGNALASGDPAEDKACEDEIIRRLDNGDVWAWACVRVHAEWEGFRGSSEWLGGCSYDSERDFRTSEGTCTHPDGTVTPWGYFLDMQREALADLRDKLADAISRGRLAATFPGIREAKS